MNELDIIRQVRAGDIDQYSQLVERYQVGLIIHCDRLLSDRDEAEDVAQKAFIKAYEKLASFDSDKARYSTWLYRIATNMCLDVLKSQKRAIPSDIEDTVGAEALDAALMHDETIREVRTAVLGLMPPEQRRVIEAYYWDGMSYQAIADEIGVPINTVKSWMYRAKQQLRSKLS
ncbi:MAG TPA: sigma-70 family RNA polymerase sigma factor [Candidatus Saccharimonadales bacterium]|nr:sigma-70 family RNA polymerase sigma factor [Candidatus Saccharimonadales bacterium]